jgi:toxin-antitoxin system PIN domain toxin
MVTPDANILLYAYNTADERHSAAKKWLENAMSGAEIFAFSWQAVTAFLRIASHPRSFPRPYSLSEITAIVGDWLDCENIILLAPTQRHWAIFNELILDGQTTGPMMMDAHLAALAIEHDATLATTDKDFSRFSGLKLTNPLR